MTATNIVSNFCGFRYRHPLQFHPEWEEACFSQCHIRSAFVSSANLPSLFQRREMWSGTFELFIETTTLTSRQYTNIYCIYEVYSVYV